MGLFIKNQRYSFLCFQNIMTCLSHSTAKYLFKLKNRKTILISQLCHAVFIFNFEHIQQITVIFLIINFKQLIIKFANWAQDEIRKIT